MEMIFKLKNLRNMIKDVKNTNFVHNSLHFPGKRYTNFYYLLTHLHSLRRRSYSSTQFLKSLHSLNKMIILPFNLSKSSHYPVSFLKSFQTNIKISNSFTNIQKDKQRLYNIHKHIPHFSKSLQSDLQSLQIIPKLM